MTRNARKRFVAWLGIAAMWLAIVAPVISQTLAARNAATDPHAILCTVDASATDAHASHHDAANHFDACSYCGLLAHDLPVATDVAHDAASIERVTRAPAFASADSVASKSFNAASPRAPPVLS
ncbi:MFS transporter [Caballeronia novacaledonica]|uniref:MFS transporter n=1 Tax=Caballeronia novacaledonica TaxID=1544861 RepID=A0A2U3I8D2_9BURK|nr:DUF2946 domain-containing protein [Caballeronia novacaledonica]SPB16414.1 MFS transporter [Caballeronia novacaledonica]